MSEQKSKIMVVDDDSFVREMLKHILESSGYLVETAENGARALSKFSSVKPDLVISDMNMPEMSGLELIHEIRTTDVDTPLVILTSNNEISTAIEAINSGANDYLLKDENIEDTIIIAIQKVFEKTALEKQNTILLEYLEQKNMALEESNNELVELNIQKNKFLRIAAHDLRTPIGGIIGLSDLLMDDADNLTDDQKEFISIINSTSNQMLTLLNDLLDISIIESGKLELQLDQHDLRDLIDMRIRINGVVADRKNITISRDFTENMELVFDANRISQVFDNLLSNAIKFSPSNSTIWVKISQRDNMVEVSIRDEGPGISEDDMSKLFSEFQKLSAKPTGGEKSTGIGLAISKKIIEAHKGVLGVESKQGEGAIFSFRIPLIN